MKLDPTKYPIFMHATQTFLENIHVEGVATRSCPKRKNASLLSTLLNAWFLTHTLLEENSPMLLREMYIFTPIL